MYSVPVLFIIFKRKDVALKSFESIRKIQPKNSMLLVMVPVLIYKVKPRKWKILGRLF